MRFAVLCLATACTTVEPAAPTAASFKSSFCAQGVPGLNHACVREFGVSGEIVEGAYVTTVFTEGNLGRADRATAGSLANGDCSSPPPGMSADTCRELLPAVCSAPVLTAALERSGGNETLATVDCHGGWAVAASPSGEHVFRFLKGAWHAVTQAGTSCHDWFLAAGVPIDACEAYHAKQAALTATR
jgi:hypothetical protein